MPISNSCFQNWSLDTISSSELKEIDCRNIVSRSYYSAYHATLCFAEDELNIPVSSATGSTHKKLADMLIAFICDDKDKQKGVRRLGARIGALHTLRVRADYLLDDTISEIDAQSIVRNTGQMIESISSLCQVSAA
jgi:hypothetical protein